MRQSAARSAAALLIAALLSPVLGAGAVLADDLRDMVKDNTGLADDPETPGPDLYAPRVWGTDIPDMPSLVVLDAPAAETLSEEPRAVGTISPATRDLAPCTLRAREISSRGPPSGSF
ncbi:MAG: hypothetical protein ACHQJD_01120 [Thermoanaerobaculia bacterium]